MYSAEWPYQLAGLAHTNAGKRDETWDELLLDIKVLKQAKKQPIPIVKTMVSRQALGEHEYMKVYRTLAHEKEEGKQVAVALATDCWSGPNGGKMQEEAKRQRTQP